MKYVIFGAAPCSYSYKKISDVVSGADCIICADGGYNTAIRCGVTPDICVGDMDSIDGNILSFHTKVIKLPRKKDDTDLMCAVKFAENNGADQITLLGVTGGRMDHTFANFCILNYLCEKNIKSKIINETCEIFMATAGQTMLLENYPLGSIVSVFPFGCKSCTVTYTGLEFPAYSKTLHCYSPIGISNTILSNKSSILVSHGTALIFIYNQI